MPKATIVSRAGSVEGEITLLLNLIAAARFEYLEQQSSHPETLSGSVCRRYVGTVAYSPLQNIKIALEYKHENISGHLGRIGTAGVTFGF